MKKEHNLRTLVSLLVLLTLLAVASCGEEDSQPADPRELNTVVIHVSPQVSPTEMPTVTEEPEPTDTPCDTGDDDDDDCNENS